MKTLTTITTVALIATSGGWAFDSFFDRHDWFLNQFKKIKMEEMRLFNELEDLSRQINALDINDPERDILMAQRETKAIEHGATQATLAGYVKSMQHNIDRLLAGGLELTTPDGVLRAKYIADREYAAVATWEPTATGVSVPSLFGVQPQTTPQSTPHATPKSEPLLNQGALPPSLYDSRQSMWERKYNTADAPQRFETEGSDGH